MTGREPRRRRPHTVSIAAAALTVSAVSLVFSVTVLVVRLVTL